MPVIAGTGSNSTQEAIELTRAAKEVGVDATLQVCPYYNKPTQEGIFHHFEAIAEAVDLPMILYNIPGRTSRNIEPGTIIRLSEEVPQIVGLKDASNDLHQAMLVLRETDRDTFQVYSGEDVMTFSLLCLGAAGAIAAVAHVVGREVRAMCDAVWAGGSRRRRPDPLLARPRHRRAFRGAKPHPGQAGPHLAGSARGPATAAPRDALALGASHAERGHGAGRMAAGRRLISPGSGRNGTATALR